MTKSINLMSVKEIKSKFSTDEIYDLIIKFTKELNKYKDAMRFAKYQCSYQVNEYYFNLTKSKIQKLESIVY